MQAFKKSAIESGIELELFGADTSMTAPALYFCDHRVQVPRIKDADYIPFLVDYCDAHQIDALIPTIDTDLLVLSESKNLFKKTRVLISDPDKIMICRDKMKTGQFFKSLGIQCPIPVDDYLSYNHGYPAFIKPKDGSSSINAYKVYDQNELESYAKMVPDYIIQPFIDGIEYTVDAFCGFDGAPIFITPRIRLAVRSGEVLKTQICQDDMIISEMQKIISVFKPCGPITVQLIRDSKSGEDYFIEINPRFGGGAPLSIKAGANSCAALLRLLNGEMVGYQYKAAEDGAVFSRFDQSIKVG